MLVTAVNVAANTVTVTRGYNGTTPAAHLAAADVVAPNLYDNQAEYGGGVDSNRSTTTVGNAAITYDTAYLASPAYFNTEGGGIYTGNGTTTISNSTISDNVGNDGTPASQPAFGDPVNYGAGVYSGGTTTITNCAINSNTLTGQTYLYGSGIYSNNTLTVSNSTISYNSGCSTAAASLLTAASPP